jgi:hypothetical protein
MVEVYSALARRKQEGSVRAADFETEVQALKAHSTSGYDFVELDLNFVHLAHSNLWNPEGLCLPLVT